MRRDRLDIGAALGLLSLVLPWIIAAFVAWLVGSCVT